jgi:hypothetical protein
MSSGGEGDAGGYAGEQGSGPSVGASVGATGAGGGGGGAQRHLSKLVRMQANLQRTLSPGNWIPFVRLPHKYFESWLVKDRSPEECVKAVEKAAEELSEKGGRWVYDVVGSDNPGEVVLCCYTKARWMDVVSIKFVPVAVGSNAAVSFYSAGMVPLSVPLAPLWSALLCWFPFYDGEIARKRWFPAVRGGMRYDIQLLQAGRKI